MAGVFYPEGPIASQEKDLMITAVLIMLVVAIPLIATLYTFAWKYRAGNKDAKREPDRVGGLWGQLIGWSIPAVIIIILSILNWNTTQALDPAKPIASNAKPLIVQVVALDWKWLFIYPEQHIATVNFVEFPANVPVDFQLTADAPMNSFWIPQLGGQDYAMQGMVNQLYLMAKQPGEYDGKATEINGAGYSGMTFKAKSVSQNDFDAWVASIANTSSTSPYPSLTTDAYETLAAPSQNNPPAYYSSVANNLYATIIMKFMPQGETMPDQDQDVRANATATSMMPMQM